MSKIYKYESFEPEEHWEENNYDDLRKGITKKVIFKMSYGWFERIVNDIYGVNYEFVADQEAHNDTSYEYDVHKRKFSEWENNSLDKFKKEGKYSYMAGTILDDLCDKGVIEEGHYIIRVSW